jgi:small subunit ribosomal protein S16
VLKIRLRRTGAKKQPRYRVVVAESSAPRDGAYVEVLGWYNPQADPAQVVINTEKAAEWIQKGAQPSDRVAYLLKQANAVETAAPAVEESEPAPAPRKRGSRAAAAAPDVAEPTATAADAADTAGTVESGTSGAVVPASEAPEEEGSAGTPSSGG